MTRLTATLRGGRGSGTRISAQSRTQRLPQAKKMPIPTGGLDAVSPLTAMPPDRAIVLDNWFPRLRDIELRKGHLTHCDTGTGAPVESVMPYNAMTGGADRLFAASDGSIWDVTTAIPAEVVTGQTNDRWQSLNMATSGGNFLIICNGEDTMQRWDGATWATLAITGLSSADVIQLNLFKNRLWLVPKESLDAYFLKPDAIQGPATRFPLGGIFQRGGVLMAIGTWALDGGDGPDDRIAFISSEGEVAVYAGTDPTNAATWTLQGVYLIGAPIGRRCVLKIGGDLAIICIDGVVPLSKAMVVERGAAMSVSITANIQPLLNSDARNFRDLFGWELCSYPLGQRAILNVPQLEDETQIQYVMNTVSGSWCRFTGMNANCWATYQELLYFGGNDGRVMLADSGGSDDGEAIAADLQGAFLDFDSPALKEFMMVRPFIITDGDVAPGIAINVDYRNTATVVSTPTTIADPAEWDEAEWDVDLWPEEENLVAEWLGVATMVGTAASVRLALAALASGGEGDIVLRVIALQILYVEGSFI